MNKAGKWLLFAGAGALALCVGTSAFLAFSSDIPLKERGAPASDEWVGVAHVHTALSDGGGTAEDVVGAAADLGLDFVLLTDHNRRALSGHRYANGVLVVMGEEVNTPSGHLLVLGDRPVRNRSRVETVPAVTADEGLRIVAHPTGRPSWKGWDTASFDGIEIWNADTERRTGDSPADWLRAVAILPWRPVTALYQLLDAPRNLELWDGFPARARVFGICSVDAHSRMPLGDEPYLPFPTYRQSFTLARQHVLLSGMPSGDASTDAHLLLDALRNGHSYCGFDGLADARGLRVRVLSTPGKEGQAAPGPGAVIPYAGAPELEVELPPAGTRAEIRVVRDGTEMARAPGPRWRGVLPGPGRYRVEAWLRVDGRTLPWILANPVWLVEGG